MGGDRRRHRRNVPLLLRAHRLLRLAHWTLGGVRLGFLFGRCFRRQLRLRGRGLRRLRPPLGRRSRVRHLHMHLRIPPASGCRGCEQAAPRRAKRLAVLGRLGLMEVGVAIAALILLGAVGAALAVERARKKDTPAVNDPYEVLYPGRHERREGLRRGEDAGHPRQGR
jgi:hypothetical protein